MQEIAKYLWLLIGTLVFLSLAFGAAVVLLPDFRDSAATTALIPLILAPLTTTISILGGIVLSRGVKDAVREETNNGSAPNGASTGGGE